RVLAQTARRLGCRSVAFTYNDPVIFMEYAIDTAIECHKLGIKTVAVTAGYINPEPRNEFFRHMDAANVDLKAFTDAFYWKICGGHLEPVLDTLRYLHHDTATWLEITTLLIPGENDSDDELAQLVTWVAGNLGTEVPVHFTAFHPDWKMMDHPSTPPATLTRARRIAMSHGLRHVYTGNVRDPVGANTYCHACGTTLIGRDGYTITAWHLDANGACQRCGTRCAGVFEAAHGAWGERRVPVRIHDRSL
ncbi:MAG: AmmeMemoRadiSam system radical SAM enzyme, partial [Thiotrichales bacterium]